MPAKSKKQYNYMQMMAHSSGEARKRKKIMGGPSPAVAREMVMKTLPKTRKKYAKPGNNIDVSNASIRRKRRNNPGHSY